MSSECERQFILGIVFLVTGSFFSFDSYTNTFGILIIGMGLNSILVIFWHNFGISKQKEGVSE